MRSAAALASHTDLDSRALVMEDAFRSRDAFFEAPQMNERAILRAQLLAAGEDGTMEGDAAMQTPEVAAAIMAMGQQNARPDGRAAFLAMAAEVQERRAQAREARQKSKENAGRGRGGRDAASAREDATARMATAASAAAGAVAARATQARIASAKHEKPLTGRQTLLRDMAVEEARLQARLAKDSGHSAFAVQYRAWNEGARRQDAQFWTKHKDRNRHDVNSDVRTARLATTTVANVQVALTDGGALTRGLATNRGGRFLAQHGARSSARNVQVATGAHMVAEAEATAVAVEAARQESGVNGLVRGSRGARSGRRLPISRAPPLIEGPQATAAMDAAVTDAEHTKAARGGARLRGQQRPVIPVRSIVQPAIEADGGTCSAAIAEAAASIKRPARASTTGRFATAAQRRPLGATPAEQEGLTPQQAEVHALVEAASARRVRGRRGGAPLARAIPVQKDTTEAMLQGEAEQRDAHRTRSTNRRPLPTFRAVRGVPRPSTEGPVPPICVVQDVARVRGRVPTQAHITSGGRNRHLEASMDVDHVGVARSLVRNEMPGRRVRGTHASMQLGHAAPRRLAAVGTAARSQAAGDREVAAALLEEQKAGRRGARGPMPHLRLPTGDVQGADATEESRYAEEARTAVHVRHGKSNVAAARPARSLAPAQQRVDEGVHSDVAEARAQDDAALQRRPRAHRGAGAAPLRGVRASRACGADEGAAAMEGEARALLAQERKVAPMRASHPVRGPSLHLHPQVDGARMEATARMAMNEEEHKVGRAHRAPSTRFAAKERAVTAVTRAGQGGPSAVVMARQMDAEMSAGIRAHRAHAQHVTVGGGAQRAKHAQAVRRTVEAGAATAEHVRAAA